MNQNPHPKNKDVYGCACCSPEFGKIFRSNSFVAKMAALEPAETAAALDYGGGASGFHRRELLKAGLAAGSALCLLPGSSLTQKVGKDAIVFTGGTIKDIEAVETWMDGKQVFQAD